VVKILYLYDNKEKFIRKSLTYKNGDVVDFDPNGNIIGEYKSKSQREIIKDKQQQPKQNVSEEGSINKTLQKILNKN
jgi:bifunctional DNA-binding transcriptional regulator/antitoxin component of YhaV-PrlF toxin-antitoxin module